MSPRNFVKAALPYLERSLRKPGGNLNSPAVPCLRHEISTQFSRNFIAHSRPLENGLCGLLEKDQPEWRCECRVCIWLIWQSGCKPKLLSYDAPNKAMVAQQQYPLKALCQELSRLLILTDLVE
jgi:hypothetical protein